MEILNVVKIPPTKAWTTGMDCVRKAAPWNCGCIFIEERADMGACRYGGVSAERYPAHPSLLRTAKYFTMLFAQVQGVAGLSTK